MSNKSWGGRFDESPDAAAVAFSTSVDVDKRLAPEDIEGSIAHARMLGARGILDQADVAKIIAGLTQLGEEVEAGTVQWDPARDPFLPASFTDELPQDLVNQRPRGRWFRSELDE